MIAGNFHIGRTSCSKSLRNYIWCRRDDKVYIINVHKTISIISMMSRIIISSSKRSVNIYSEVNVDCHDSILSNTNFLLINRTSLKNLKKVYLLNSGVMNISLLTRPPIRLSKFLNNSQSMTSQVCNTDSNTLVDFPLLCNINSEHNVSILLYIFKSVGKSLSYCLPLRPQKLVVK